MTAVAAVFGVIVAVVIICLLVLVVLSILRTQRKAIEETANFTVVVDPASIAVHMATPETTPNINQQQPVIPLGDANRSGSINHRTKRKRRKNKTKVIQKSFPAMTFQQICVTYELCDPRGGGELKSSPAAKQSLPSLEVIAVVDQCSGDTMVTGDHRYHTAMERQSRSYGEDANGICDTASTENLESDDQELSFLAFGVSIKDEGSIKGCAVCLCSFKGSDVVRLLSCDHIFHQSCIDSWLKRHNDCPLCKLCLFNTEDQTVKSTSSRPRTSLNTSADYHSAPWQRPAMFPGVTSGYVPRTYRVRHNELSTAYAATTHATSDRTTAVTATRGRVRTMRSALGTVRQAMPQFWDRNRRKVSNADSSGGGVSEVVAGDAEGSIALTVAATNGQAGRVASVGSMRGSRLHMYHNGPVSGQLHRTALTTMH